MSCLRSHCDLEMHLKFNKEVSDALRDDHPIVALESTVIAHGLPYPDNVQTAKNLEDVVRKNGATPATIAVFDGELCVGLGESRIEQLASDTNIRKISRKDLPIAVAKGLNCATTVASTMFIAYKAGINVFATGGIGGVHRGFSADISADLPELSNTRMITVCAGAKIVLDLPSTREWLETNGVTVLGYRCSEMPAFYGRSSGIAVDERVESVQEIVEIANARNKLGLRNTILLTVPVPREFEIDPIELERVLKKSLELAEMKNIQGKEITPFLLSEMSRISEGKTLETNIALLENNAKIASEIAVALGRN